MMMPTPALRIGIITIAILLLHTSPSNSTPSDSLDLARVDSLWAAGAREESDRSVVELLAHATDPAHRGRLLLRRGAHAAAFGAGRSAEGPLREARRLVEEHGVGADLRSVVRWLSVALGQQGRLDEARELYLELEVLSRAAGDVRHEGYAHVGLGWDAVESGLAAAAAEHYRRGAELLRAAGDPHGELWARNGLGTALTRLGRYDEATANYSEAVTVARAMPFPTAEAIALNNLGNLEYALGDPGRAQQHFEEAVRIHTTLGNLRESVIPTVNLAMCATFLGRYESAARNLEEALVLCQEEGFRDHEAMVLSQMGALHRRQGLQRGALARHREVLAMRTVAPFRMRIEGLVGAAECLAELDSLPAALGLLDEAVALYTDATVDLTRLELELLRGELLLRAGHPEDGDRVLAWVVERAEAGGLGGILVQALPLAARARMALGQAADALTLRERAIEAWEAERNLPLDPDWREMRSGAGRRIFTEYALQALTDVASGAKSPAQVFDRLQAYKARTMRERMAGPDRVRADLLTEGLPVTFARLQDELLADGEVFLDFHVGPEASLLFVIDREKVEWRELPGARKLDNRLERLHRILSDRRSAGGQEGIRATATALAEDLFGPLRPAVLAAESRIISPDGLLNLVPIESLIALAGGDLGRSARVPSASVLADLRSETRPALPLVSARILTVGTFGALPGADREIATLGKRYRSVEAWVPGEADLNPAGPDLAGAALIHFACHARGMDAAPWRSWIDLSADGIAADRHLEAGRILELELEARLVVMSSCRSAAGMLVSGEGMLGLSSAFLVAGAPTVLATLWPVDDGATAGLVQHFYAGLAEGRSVGEALVRAQDALRANPATAHPSFWAGFVITGEGDTRLPLATRSRHRLYFLASALLGLAALGLRIRRS